MPAPITCAVDALGITAKAPPPIGYQSAVTSGILAKMEDLRLSPGSLLADRFEIERAAVSGGMGTIYRAMDRQSGDTVALKLLRSERALSHESERFAREAQLLSEIRHPGIVAHVAHGTTLGGQPFLAMEWLDGQDLGERLLRGPLPIRDCLRLLAQIADALSIAHHHGIVHRDLKPSNLFLVGGDIGRVKILDFGIARRLATAQAMTKTGVVVGTPEYMAPEQARGSRELTPATDLFAIGCVLYECLAGQPPFIADHIAAVLTRILFEEPIPVEQRRPGVPASLALFLDRLLKKDPGQRIADAAVLRAELLTLGEMPELAVAVTAVRSNPKAASFADQEQSLLSIVLAAPAAEENNLGTALPDGDMPLGKENRQSLLQALVGLGVVPDFLANGTLLVTVPPLHSAQDQAALAALAALLIKDRWPMATVSMATGRGAVHGRTTVGDVVEQAARSLKSASHPASEKPMSGVLIDPLSAKLLEGRFVQTPLPGGVLLLHEECDVDESRLLLGKPTPCVGREPELANLLTQLRGCIEESEARVVLITAPPGTGKSRLRHEFLRRVGKRSEPVTVLLGRGDMMSAGTPYGILRSALHRLCGISGGEPLDIQRARLRTRVARHLAATDAERVVLFIGELCKVPFPDEGKPILQTARQDPKIMRDRLRHAVWDFLLAECTAAPLLLVLDDLQWGDELTVSALDEALRLHAAWPLLVLSFSRPEVHEIFPKLWQSHRMQSAPLKGLSKKACEQLIVQVLGQDVAADAVARAVEQSAGNAFFLEELIRSLAEGKAETQSETVVAMLQARLSRLPPGARRAVRAASVFGQTFWRGGVAALLSLVSTAPEVDAWLAELIDAELIQRHPQSRFGDQSEYGFRHVLMREAAYHLLTSHDLFVGHRLAGEFLEGAGEPNAAVVGEHFERGGEKQRAAVCYLRAAEQTLLQGDLAYTLRHVARGLGCAPEGELLGNLRSVQCFASGILNRFEGLGEVCDAALQKLRAGSLGWCRTLPIAVGVALNNSDPLRAAELVLVLLATEPDSNARVSYINALTVLSWGLVIGAPAQILEALKQRLSMYVELSHLEYPALRRYLYFLHAEIATFRLPRPFFLITEGELARDCSREVGDKLTEMTVEANLLPWGFLELGDRDGALARLFALEAPLLKSQQHLIVGVWRQVLGRVLSDSADESDWIRAEQLIAPMLNRTGGLRLLPVLAHGVLARVALRRGQLEAAEAYARAAMQAFLLMPCWLSPVAAVQIHALLGQRRAGEALAVAEQVLSTIPTLGGLGVFEVEFRLAASEAFYGAGDHARADIEMHETLRQIELRADDITNPFWKNSYLTRNPYCVKALALAKQRGLSWRGSGSTRASDMNKLPGLS